MSISGTRTKMLIPLKGGLPCFLIPLLGLLQLRLMIIHHVVHECTQLFQTMGAFLNSHIHMIQNLLPFSTEVSLYKNC